MRTEPPIIVSIAGTDPSGGAGIQADIKAISATGGYAASIITALVAQNTIGVQDILEIPTAFIRRQFASVFDDLSISAVKIGMLHKTEVILTVAEELARLKPPSVVYDPVMIAKSGCALIDISAIQDLCTHLIPLARLITPNIPEAEELLAAKISQESDMMNAAKTIAERFKTSVLIKGGHLSGANASDFLYSLEDHSETWFHQKRISSQNTHGTGCSLSSAIASYLGQNLSLTDAIAAAKNYLSKALLGSKNWQLGNGNGPIDHFYFLKPLNQ